MNADDIEGILEAGAESPTLDFKASCPWNALTFAKDILAFSNLEDGGRIVIGVEDQTYRRIGVTPEDEATYRIDTMRDQMASFADPHVQFRVDTVTDRAGIRFVVLTVDPFDEIPVICRRDSAETRAGVIYHRNRNRRVESAPVSNSADLRLIIELAAVRMTKRWRRLGVQLVPEEAQRLQDELEGL